VPKVPVPAVKIVVAGGGGAGALPGTVSDVG
jgi:phosphoribosylcarboxyaminoimidazole (NCAIR) mutase